MSPVVSEFLVVVVVVVIVVDEGVRSFTRFRETALRLSISSCVSCQPLVSSLDEDEEDKDDDEEDEPEVPEEELPIGMGVFLVSLSSGFFLGALIEDASEDSEDSELELPTWTLFSCDGSWEILIVARDLRVRAAPRACFSVNSSARSMS